MRHNYCLDEREYSARIEQALILTALRVPLKGSHETLRVYTPSGRATECFVTSTAAHQLGIVHKTSDALVVLPSREIVVQRRSASDTVFPRGIGLSAGGHMGINEDPSQTLQREMEEELALVIKDRRRFVPLSSPVTGFSLYCLSAVYRNGQRAAHFVKHARTEALRLVTGAANVPEELIERLSAWADQCPWKSPPTECGGWILDGAHFNQEWTHYYIVPITQGEYETIRTCPREVSELLCVSLSELRTVASDPFGLATDSLVNLKANGAFEKLEAMLERLEWG